MVSRPGQLVSTMTATAVSNPKQVRRKAMSSVPGYAALETSMESEVAATGQSTPWLSSTMAGCGGAGPLLSLAEAHADRRTDVGDRRIGVAISDEKGDGPRRPRVLTRTTLAADLVACASASRPTAVVDRGGLPKNMNGIGLGAEGDGVRPRAEAALATPSSWTSASRPSEAERAP
jgi:hypothetical protein